VARQNPEGYDKFLGALRKVLTVSHSDMKRMRDTEKAEKKRKSKRASASRASDDKG
jgi:hypothetical protein